MNDIKRFLVSGGKEGRIEYVRIKHLNGKVNIENMSYSEFIYDAMSDTKNAEALRLVLSGAVGVPTLIDSLVEYAQYHYQDDVDNYRMECGE